MSRFATASGGSRTSPYSADTPARGDGGFAAILDEACARLQEQKAVHAAKRLRELDAVLEDLERELGALIPQD